MAKIAKKSVKLVRPKTPRLDGYKKLSKTLRDGYNKLAGSVDWLMQLAPIFGAKRTNEDELVDEGLKIGTERQLDRVCADFQNYGAIPIQTAMQYIQDHGKEMKEEQRALMKYLCAKDDNTCPTCHRYLK